MANRQKAVLPLPLSFNLELSDGSSLGESTSDINDIENFFPKPRQHAQQLFKKQPAGKMHARASVLPKFNPKRKIMPFSSTPKLSIPSSESSGVDISPITNKSKYDQNRVHTRSFDELPPSKRLKTSNVLEISVRVNAKEKEVVDRHASNISRNRTVLTQQNDQELSENSVTLVAPDIHNFSLKQPTKRAEESDLTKAPQNKRENITVRKTMAKNKNMSATENLLDTIDVLDRRELMESRNLTYEGVDVVQKNTKPFLANGNTNRSFHDDCSGLPHHSQDKDLKAIKSVFDRSMGLSASIILISSECSNSYDYYQVETEKPTVNAREISKKNVSVNTTKVQNVPKINKKCTVSTQKNAIRNISTNTTPLNESIDGANTVVNKMSKKSVGTNTSDKKNRLKIKKSSISANKKKRSLLPNNSPVRVQNETVLKRIVDSPKPAMKSARSTLHGLRPRNKTIDYSYSTSNSTSNIKPSSDDTGMSQTKRNYTTVKQTRKRRQKSIIPSALKKSTKPKIKKERLSGFFEKDVSNNAKSNGNNSETRRSRRPPSLFIQHHSIGPGPLKKVLLKKMSTRVSTRKNYSEIDEDENKGNGARKSKRGRKRKTDVESASNSDDTIFKKPLPVRNMGISSSTTTSSVSTVALDKEPFINSPLIETIDEISYDEDVEADTVKETSFHPTQVPNKPGHTSKNVSKNIITDKSPVKNQRKSSTNATPKETPIEKNQSYEPTETRKSPRQKSSLESIKTPSKDSGLVTISSNLVIESNSLNDPPPYLTQTTQSDVEQSTSCPLNEAIYEIDGSLKNSNSIGKQTSLVGNLEATSCSNSVQSSPQSFSRNQPATTDKSATRFNQANLKEAVINKPRKSVTFCEPIALEHEFSIQKEVQIRTENLPGSSGLNTHANGQHAALALSERRNQEPTQTDASAEEDNSETELLGKDALCTLIDNKAVLLRKWNSDMPDLTSITDNCLVKYTLQNIPYVMGNTLSSGCFVLGPGKKKPKHATMKQCLFFHILHGEARVNVQGLKFIGKAGSHFFVPLGSIYSIANIKFDKQLVVFFLKF